MVNNIFVKHYLPNKVNNNLSDVNVTYVNEVMNIHFAPLRHGMYICLCTVSQSDSCESSGLVAMEQTERTVPYVYKEGWL